MGGTGPIYAMMKARMGKLPIVAGGEVKMKMVTQNLIADVGGEPFETLRLAATREGTIKVSPFYDSCLDLGIDREKVGQLVADATSKVEEAKSTRASR